LENHHTFWSTTTTAIWQSVIAPDNIRKMFYKLVSHLVAVPVCTNAAIDNNAAPHHSGSDHEAEG